MEGPQNDREKLNNHNAPYHKAQITDWTGWVHWTFMAFPVTYFQINMPPLRNAGSIDRCTAEKPATVTIRSCYDPKHLKNLSLILEIFPQNDWKPQI